MLNVVVFNNNSERYLLKSIESIMSQKDVIFNLFVVDLNSKRFNYKLIINELTKQREEFEGNIVVEESDTSNSIASALEELFCEYEVRGDVIVLEAGDCFEDEKALYEILQGFEKRRPVYIYAKNTYILRDKRIKVEKFFPDNWSWGSMICEANWLLEKIRADIENFSIFDLLLKVSKHHNTFEDNNYIDSPLWKKRIHINMYEYDKYIRILEECYDKCSDLVEKGKIQNLLKKEKHRYSILEKRRFFQKIFFFDFVKTVKELIVKNKKILHSVSSWSSICLHFIFWYLFNAVHIFCIENGIEYKSMTIICKYCEVAIPLFLVLHLLINEQDMIKKRIKW